MSAVRVFFLRKLSKVPIGHDPAEIRALSKLENREKLGSVDNSRVGFCEFGVETRPWRLNDAVSTHSRGPWRFQDTGPDRTGNDRDARPSFRGNSVQSSVGVLAKSGRDAQECDSRMFEHLTRVSCASSHQPPKARIGPETAFESTRGPFDNSERPNSALGKIRRRFQNTLDRLARSRESPLKSPPRDRIRFEYRARRDSSRKGSSMCDRIARTTVF